MITPDVCDLLTAIHDALTAPDPAAGEFAAYEQLIAMRAAALRGVITATLDNPRSVEDTIRHIQVVVVDEYPATYPTRTNREGGR